MPCILHYNPNPSVFVLCRYSLCYQIFPPPTQLILKVRWFKPLLLPFFSYLSVYKRNFHHSCLLSITQNHEITCLTALRMKLCEKKRRNHEWEGSIAGKRKKSRLSEYLKFEESLGGPKVIFRKVQVFSFRKCQIFANRAKNDQISAFFLTQLSKFTSYLPPPLIDLFKILFVKSP